jgi:16S rRNA (guanine527-N7)-methyltransferase
MVTRHLLDSLSIARFVTGASVVDVGTGAGIPGIVLAVLYPEKRFDLVDGNGKKTRFLFQVKTSLGLDNIAIYNERVEKFHPDCAYDQVVSRAFASLGDMVSGCRHLLRLGGEFLAMKGARPDAELATIEHVCNVAAVDAVTVPGLEERRHVVRLTLK